jgi:hypothetical protein
VINAVIRKKIMFVARPTPLRNGGMVEVGNKMRKPN